MIDPLLDPQIPGPNGPRLPKLARYLLLAACAALATLGPLMAQTGAASRDDQVKALADRAREEVDKGQFFDAIKTLDQAVEIAPERLDLRLQLARLQKARGMWIRSAEQYKAVLEADPGLVEAHLGYAELLLADYQFKAAAEQFERVLESDPEHKDKDRALVGLGTAQYGMEDYKTAAVTFDELLHEHPENPTARAYKNLTLRKLGDLDGAIQGWREFIRRKPGVARAEALKIEAEELKAEILDATRKAQEEPENPRAHIELGDLMAEKADLPSAAVSYQKAADLEPDKPEALLRLGLSLRDTGRCRKAMDQFAKLARTESFAVIGGYNLAYCAKELGEQDQEVDAWNEVVVASPRDAFAYRKYLDALARAGKTEDELALLLRSIKGRASDPLPRIQYGILASRAGKPEEAARAFLDALSLEPNDVLASLEVARLLYGRSDLATRLLAELEGSTEEGTRRVYARSALLGAVGRASEAVKLLSTHLESNPGDARAAVAMALLERTAGKPAAEVVPLLEKARQAEPGYFYARLHLAVVLESIGQFTQAAAEAREAVRIEPDDPYALTILGSALRNIGTRESKSEAFRVLEKAVRKDPMDRPGSSRLLLAKVAWQLGFDNEARLALGGDLPVEPQDMYDLAWEFVRDSYGDRTFNGQDWMQWRDRYDGRLNTRSDALAAIALMLASLDDRDTRLRSLDQTLNIIFAKRSTKLEKDPSGRASLSSKTVESKVLEENVGYLAVSNMADPKLLEEVEGAVEKLKDRDAVIIDLRGNQGGAERPVEQVTAMLIPKDTPTGTIVTGESKEEVKTEGEKPPVIPEKPMVVLVDEHTASSAEVLAGALKESKRAVVVGNRSYGKAGIQVPRLLPDGTTLLIAVAESANLEGESYSGVGIEPDFEIQQDVMGSSDPASDPAVKKARELLRKARDKRRGVVLDKTDKKGSDGND